MKVHFHIKESTLSTFGVASGYLPAMSAKKEFAIRLADAMSRQGLEPKAAVIERGYNDLNPDATISVQTAGAWLRGAHMPDEEHMEGLAAWLRVDLQTLRKGKLRFRVGEQGSSSLPQMGKQDTATMNVWLIKQVMSQLAANGGKVPANLM